VLGVVVARARPRGGSGKVEKAGPPGDRGATGCRWERLAGGQWERCTAELNPERAGGSEHKKV